MISNLIPSEILNKFEVQENHHAAAVLYSDFRAEWDDLMEFLSSFRLKGSDVIGKGGNKSKISQTIDAFFYGRNWREHEFQIEVKADGETRLAPTHHLDYFRGRVAIETEWNNKDPFFDRDLTTFRLLFEMNVLSVGIIITRGSSLDEFRKKLGKKTSGTTTTHMGKLIPKLRNRASGGCPVLAFGITEASYHSDL